MVKESEPSNNEKVFLLQALKEGHRADGRGPYDTRPINLKFGEEWGQVEVQLGQTRVVANVSSEVVRPYPDQPNEGFLIINTEISPMASPAFEAGRQSEDEIVVSRLMEKALKRSRAIDTEALCIVAGEKVWSIRVDVHFLDHEGNLIDCTCIAIIAALLHYRRPDVTVIGESVTIHSVEQRNPVPLSIHHIPLCVTFNFFDNGELLVVDPNLLEEQIRAGDMTIAMNTHKEICALSKAGGIPLEMDQLMRCSKAAVIKVADITDQIQKSLKADLDRRQSK